MSTPTSTATHDAMRAWAKGDYTLEAGIELAIRTGTADRGEFRACWQESYGGLELVQDDLLHLMRRGVPWSGGERRMLCIVASLLNPLCPVNIGDFMPGMDRRNVNLVLAALSHAAGSHEHYNPPAFIAQAEGIALEPTVDDAGRLAPLHPWPAS